MKFPVVVSQHALSRFLSRCAYRIDGAKAVELIADAARSGTVVGAAFDGESHRLLEFDGAQLVVAVKHAEDRLIAVTTLTWQQFVANQSKSFASPDRRPRKRFLRRQQRGGVA